MSRSAFAARFNELVGEAPMRYLTQWRMHLSQRLEYQSEAAFNRSFKKVIGLTPAKARTRA